jgi:hypothetical protein
MGGNSTTVYCEIYPQNNESVTFSPTSTYSGCLYDHVCGTNTWKTNLANAYVGGNLVVTNNKFSLSGNTLTITV